MIGFEEKKFFSQGITVNCRYDGRDSTSISKLTVDKGSVVGSQGSSVISYVDSIVTCTLSFKINTEYKISIKAIYSGSSNNDRILCWDKGERLSYQILSLMFTNDKLKDAFEINESGHYWSLEVNLMVSQAGGSLVDASSYAIVAALSNVSIPQINVIKRNDDIKLTIGNGVDDKIIDIIKSIPIVVSCGVLNKSTVWSMCENEEKCVDTVISFAIDKSAKILVINGISNDSVDYNMFMSKATEIALKLYEML